MVVLDVIHMLEWMFNVSQGRAVLLSRMLHPYCPTEIVYMHSTDFSENGSCKIAVVFQPVCTLTLW